MLRVLNETLTYEVDQIHIVLPQEVDDLAMVPGRDFCTLVTCTPYGINSHRLLVRGKRMPADRVEDYPQYGEREDSRKEKRHDKRSA